MRLSASEEQGIRAPGSAAGGAVIGSLSPMADRIMFVQLKAGYDVDEGPAWNCVVSFNRSWQTAPWHGKTLRRASGLFDANFYDTATDDEYWLSGPHRDRTDTRYSNIRPTIDEDARQA